MKKFIYAFKPFGKFKTNSSEKILKSIKGKSIKKVFDVKFDKQMFLKEIKKHNPDIIIGIGMVARSKKVRIERKAVNKMKNKKIAKKRKDALFTTLRIRPTKTMRISYDAGTYVCNYSMYTILHRFKDKKYAFFHVPYKMTSKQKKELITTIDKIDGK